jgi:hypothetical protein
MRPCSVHKSDFGRSRPGGRSRAPAQSKAERAPRAALGNQAKLVELQRGSVDTAALGGAARPWHDHHQSTAARLQRALAQGQLRRKCGARCDCEDCSTWQGKALQKKVRIGAANDAFEREADTLADKVVAGQRVSVGLRTGPTVHAKRSESESGGSASGAGLGPGAALPGPLQAEVGPLLGRDLGGVRVHTGAVAAGAAASVGARAFTLGRDLVFGAGEWAPGTREGKKVIAHELVHWAQQGGRTDRVQRLLRVDASASDDPSTAVSMMTPLLRNLCDGFDVGSSGTVTAVAGSECASGKFGNVATGSKPLGCCCLCTLARAPDQWTIVVTNTDAPSTDPASRTVRMTQVGVASAPTFRHWSSGAGGATERRVNLAPVEAFGHELCGHAALMQIRAHPPSLSTTPDRAFSDVHDPTVRVQNALASELGLAGARRGLADQGVHRGESLRAFVVEPFGFNDVDATPFASTITAARSFMNANPRLMADVVGFRESGELSMMSVLRAINVMVQLAPGVTPPTRSIQTNPSAAPITVPRVQAPTDGGTGTPSRRVEILMASFPAGLNTPPGPAPPSPSVPVGPEFPAVVSTLRAGRGVNACHKLLSDTAWPAPPPSPAPPARRP